MFLFSSLADSSSTVLALETSVIKESRAPAAACSSLLDVLALGSPVSSALSHDVSSEWGRPLSSPIKFALIGCSRFWLSPFGLYWTFSAREAKVNGTYGPSR